MQRQHFMSIVKANVGSTRADQDRSFLPPLENGDHLSRAEFERRWEAMPNVKKAELIDGVVYMPAAVRDDCHGEPHAYVIGWLVNYALCTPGVRTGNNSSTRIDDDNMPQPDAFLRLPESMGSTVQRAADGYLHGVPDLVVEVAASSASIDLHRKLEVYRRSGVREYVVWRTLEEEIDWFVLDNGNFERRARDADGWFRSRLFPGLWLQPDVLMHGLPDRVHLMMHEGMKSPEHAAFVKALAEATKS